MRHVQNDLESVFMIDPYSPTALYLQLAEILAGRIERGELPAGKPIPSETALQQEFQLSRGTVRAAVGVLRDRGLIVTAPARGSYVAEHPGS